MRSSQQLLLALALLLAFCQVDAIFRPSGYKHHPPPSSYHHGNEEDCETPKPKTTTVKAETTTVVPETTTEKAATTTKKVAKKCPEGFLFFYRVGSAVNENTEEWCLKAVVQKDPIKVSDANALCAAHGAVLSGPHSDIENYYLTTTLLEAVQSYGYTSGAIAVDGRRNAECVTRNKTILETLPCSDKSLSFHLTDPHTNPEYMWSNWAVEEPTANAWTYDIEECVQLAVIPGNADRNERFNDIYCNMVQAPNDPEYTLYWNFGAVCGRAPE